MLRNVQINFKLNTTLEHNFFAKTNQTIKLNLIAFITFIIRIITITM